MGPAESTLEVFPVDHSTQVPPLGYCVTAGRVAIFCVPDVVWMRDRREALTGVDLYIGDGAMVSRSTVSKSGGTPTGHTPLRTQLTWCEREGVPEAIFTHCGFATVKADHEAVDEQMAGLAEKHGVRAEVAVDGAERMLR